MHMRGTFFFGILLAGTAASMVACGSKSASTSSSSGTGTPTSTSSATTGSGGASSSATGTGGGAPDCKKACTDLYNCGLAKDMTMMQYCPGFKGGMELDTFLNGKMMDGCIASCMQMSALVSFVDPKDCKKTVDFISGVSPAFKCTCAKGLGHFDDKTMTCM